MNEQQARLLLETEYQFYKLQADTGSLRGFLIRIGFKPDPDISRLTNAELTQLNFRIRQFLRTGPF